MRLPSLFQDGMVLQREVENYIWGITTSEQKVKGRFGGKSFETTANVHGEFKVQLPKLPVGGPYEMEIEDKEKIKIKDILIGDVFLLGGQSNMELPVHRTLELFRKEIKEIDEEEIRMFELPKEYKFDGERSFLEQGSWKKAQRNDILEFSAVGLFMARALREKYKIPIGLLQSAVGGTPIKAWCSEETINDMGIYVEELEQCKQLGYVKKVEQEEVKKEQEWLKEANQSMEGIPIKEGKIQIPGIWKEGELFQFHGAICLERKVTLTQVEAAKDAEILLGAIVDADKVFINGVYCGETGYKYPPRIYPVPKGILKEGENTIRIQICVFRNTGGFVEGKKYGLRFCGDNDQFIDLSGVWNYKIMKYMDKLEETTFFNYKASSLYNGMLAPIKNYQIACCMFYQGESNTGNPYGYAKEFRAMIQDWRQLFEKPEMPFSYVQLAGFSDGELEHQGRNWAVLRREQEKVLDIPNTEMVQAYDLGEYNDLHPLDKKTVGQRLALAVRKLWYGEEIECLGPVVTQIKVTDNNQVHIIFDRSGREIRVRDESGKNMISGIELKDERGIYAEANAILTLKGIIAWLPRLEKPKGIRYAWKDCPIEANLYGNNGLPVVPFEKEWE